MDSFNNNSDKFVEWLANDANVKISSKIEIADLRALNQGRCVRATQDIKQDEVLFEIPRDSILNIDTCKLSEKYPDAKETLFDGVGHWEGLILVLLYELKVCKEESQWWPYFEVFPSVETMNGLMYWSDEELTHLKPSLVLDRIGRDSAHEMFETVKQLIQEFKIEDESMKSISWDDFVYVASVIMSYSFDVEDYEAEDTENESRVDDDEGEEEIEIIHGGRPSVRQDKSLKSMIPLADTLNADTKKCNANLMYDELSLKMHAIKRIAKGEQVYNLYGEHPNSEILRRYGYVEEEGSKYDFGEVPLETIEKVLYKEYKDISNLENILTHVFDGLREDDVVQENLEFENIVLDSCECYIDGGVPSECALFLQILVVLLQIPGIDEFSSDELTRHLQRVSKKCFQLLQSGKITKQCDTIWKQAINERLEDYDLDVNLDINKLHTVRDAHNLRHIMASVVLKCEVDSLKACKEAFNQTFKVIDDSKLMNNILKRKIDVEPTPKKIKRVKRRDKK